MSKENEKKNLRFVELHEPLTTSDFNKDIFNITEDIVKSFKINILNYSTDMIFSSNYVDFFELVYFVVKSAIKKIETPEYSGIHDVIDFNIRLNSLYVEPTDITLDEILLFDGYIFSMDEAQKNNPQKLTHYEKRNYLINLNRILKNK